jgi:hypothetical protein
MNVIEFISHREYARSKQEVPIPIRLNVPKWYRELSNRINDPTIKACMPFLDTLTTGYLLKTPQDLYLHHNKDMPDGTKGTFQRWGLKGKEMWCENLQLNLNTHERDIHSPHQLKGSPQETKNKRLPFLKFLNPWIIKTPPGYSCLFVPPLNNADDRFSIIPGIVDTDTFTSEINFPFVVNGDKYPELETIIKRGTPFVQVIPFKKENWEMKIIEKSTEELGAVKLWHRLDLWQRYKTKFWNRKKWK